MRIPRDISGRELARALWVPAVNNHASASLSTGSGFGRWALLEIQDPWNAANLIRAFLKTVEYVHV